MADISRLALRAAQIKYSGNALTIAQAIDKAIRGQGITNGNDIKRLMREVGTQYARNERATQNVRGRK